MIFVKDVMFNDQQIKNAFPWEYRNINGLRCIGLKVSYLDGSQSVHRDITIEDLKKVMQSK